VEQYGGKIWCKSHVGVGSKFCFTIEAKRNTRKVPKQVDNERVESKIEEKRFKFSGSL